MEKRYILKDWFVCEASDNPFLPPEVTSRKLGGKVYGHPKYEDGTKIKTSRIIDSKGKSISTYSGSVYVLEGPPEEEYAKWCAENNLEIDPENPIKKKISKHLN